MKKIILTLVLVMSFAFTYGQTKWQEKQNKYFVEAAAKEYSLDDKQQKRSCGKQNGNGKIFYEY